jgi:hypothetical protein
MKGGRFMKKCNDVKAIIILFSLYSLCSLPCVSFATTFSDIQLGNENNKTMLILDSHGPGSDPLHGPIHGFGERTEYGHGHSGGEPRPTPAPVPAAVWLLGSGLVGLIGIKRKRQK